MSIQSVLRHARAASSSLPLLAALLAVPGCTPSSPSEAVGHTSAAVCANATLSPSVPSAGPGAIVTWTGSASCDPGDVPYYEFYMAAPGQQQGEIVQAYGGPNTFTWDTTGLAEGVYTFTFLAISDSSQAWYDSYQDVTFELTSVPACTGGALTYGPISPALPGTLVTVTGSAASCGGTPEYEFWMQQPGDSWTLAQPYSPSSTYAWDTTGGVPGYYDFAVMIRNQGSTADYQTGADPGFILASQAPCTGGALTYGPVSPAVIGALVTATATATCPGTPEYQFWMQTPGGSAVIVQPYGPSSTYAWDTSGFDAGYYYVTVGIRNQGSLADYETAADPGFILASQPPCTDGALTYGPVSPAVVGALVTATATATCPGTPEYQFWMQPPGGSAVIVQPYGPNSTYAWDTTGLDAGYYDVTVGIRNQGSTADYETSADPGFVLASQAPCTDGALTYGPVSPAVIGALVTATATATCPGTPEYQFSVQPPGGSAVIVQTYGSSSTYAWDTTGLTAGDYDLTVEIRNQGSTADYETSADPVFTLTQ